MSRLIAAALRPSDLAIDVGTATVRFAGVGSGLGECRAVSAGRRPLAGGVIIDSDAAIELLHPIVRRARGWLGLSRVRALACAPTDATDEEKATLAECLIAAGVTSVFISPEPLAAAVGGGVDVACRYSKVLVDLGEGVTDCALLHSAQIVTSVAVRKGCAALRERVQKHVANTYGFAISDTEADAVLRSFDLREGMPGSAKMAPSANNEWRTLRLTAEGLRGAIWPQLRAIIDTIHRFMRDLPPRVAAEAIEDGMFLSGGGALLPGMSQLIAETTGVHVHVLADPLRAVVRGAQEMLPAAAALQLWADR